MVDEVSLAEPLPEALGWLDAKKQAAIASLANLLSDPRGTMQGWGDVLAQGARSFGKPVQSMQSVMPEVREAGLQQMAQQAPGFMAGTVHRFPLEATRPSLEGYTVKELAPGLDSTQLLQSLKSSAGPGLEELLAKLLKLTPQP